MMTDNDMANIIERRNRLDMAVSAASGDEFFALCNKILKEDHPALVAEVRRLREALKEIAKGEGRFSRDPLEHAANCIEDMKAVATQIKAGGVSIDAIRAAYAAAAGSPPPRDLDSAVRSGSMRKREVFGWSVACIVGLAVMIALAFALELGGLKWKSFFAPRHEAVRRQVFKQTRSYNEGKEQELLKYRHEWMQADADGRAAIASTVRHAFADYDETLLAAELRSFLRKIKYGD